MEKMHRGGHSRENGPYFFDATQRQSWDNFRDQMSHSQLASFPLHDTEGENGSSHVHLDNHGATSEIPNESF